MIFNTLRFAVFPPQANSVDQLLEIGADGAIGLLRDRLLWTASRDELESGRSGVVEKLSRLTAKGAAPSGSVDRDLELM